ncbi:hypothetical protein BJ508DRAFT_359080 [Ascobolus immersus RN42]|uniref:CENP-V/GFA domain-containing protein n=1 Tax=Ascobolus immersus RN42 TaxID=1160509 RepID=A0A3N4IMJ0_ASCIM|nr:hypothetical protein BJ508DRAFT_359080 [Ascobolus immersus RN42]
MTKLSLTCNCGANNIDFKHSEPLPLRTDRPAYLCPCDTCRFGTGFLATLLVDIPKKWINLPHAHLGKTSTYKTEHHGTKYFCSNCGSGLYYALDEILTIYLPALRLDGKLPTISPGLARIVSLPTGNALKSSISSFLRTAVSHPHITSEDQEDKHPSDTLNGTCLCRSTKIEIRRPPADYMKDPILKEWVYPPHASNTEHGKPRLAVGLCHCHSCRLGSSTPFYAWIFTPRPLLTVTGDKIKAYDSAPEKGVRRRFCGECGSQVTFSRRDDMWDVSCALMDLEELKDGRWARWSFKEVGEMEAVKRRPADNYIEGWTEGRDCYTDFGKEWWGELVGTVRDVANDLKQGNAPVVARA